MEGFAIFLFFFYSIVNVILCAWLAGEKNRSVGSWLTLAIFFGFLATAFLMAAPVVSPSDTPPVSIEDFGKVPEDNKL